MDWKNLIAELRQRGWTQKLLADEIGISQSSVSDLSTGTTQSPAYSVGRALELLHGSGRLPEPAINA